MSGNYTYFLLHKHKNISKICDFKYQKLFSNEIQTKCRKIFNLTFRKHTVNIKRKGTTACVKISRTREMIHFNFCLSQCIFPDYVWW